MFASAVSSIQAMAHQIGLKCSSRVHLCDNATAEEHSSSEYPFSQKPWMVKVLFCSWNKSDMMEHYPAENII